MDHRLQHDSQLVGYQKTGRKSGLQEIAVYADGKIKKIDLAVKGHYLEWVHPDPAAFMRFNKLPPPM